MRLIAVGAVLALASIQVAGHARLTESEPAEGSTVGIDDGPLTLHFSEPIRPRFSDFAIHYLGDDGEAEPGADNRLQRQEPTLDADRRQVMVPLPESPAPGWYALDWEVLADDGHTTGGILRFRLTP